MKSRTSPHIHKNLSAPHIYIHVLLALLPCCLAAVFYYGFRAAILIIWASFLFFVSDRIISIKVRRDKNYYDLSGVISGIVIVLLLPPNVSLVTVSIGVLFASLVIKQFFGGVGANLFNPALAGRAFIEIVYSDQIQKFSEPMKDRLALATLFTSSESVQLQDYSYDIQSHFFELISGSYPGLMGVTGAFFAVVGGVYLIWKGIIRPQAILSFFIMLVVLYPFAFFGRATAPGLATLLLSNGVVFIAVFAINDYSTTPSSRIGRIIFGAGTATLLLIMKAFDAHIGALIFPVLAMNMITPLIEFYVRPPVFGLDKNLQEQIENEVIR